VKRIRTSNGWKLVLLFVAASVITAVGARHIWMSREPLLLKQQVFNELSRNRALLRERDVLGRQIYELRATPRVNLWASDLLGMRVPRPDEVIRVEGKEEDK